MMKRQETARRIISLLLAVIMVLALGTAAFAQEDAAAQTEALAEESSETEAPEAEATPEETAAAEAEDTPEAETTEAPAEETEAPAETETATETEAPAETQTAETTVYKLYLIHELTTDIGVYAQEDPAIELTAADFTDGAYSLEALLLDIQGVVYTGKTEKLTVYESDFSSSGSLTRYLSYGIADGYQVSKKTNAGISTATIYDGEIIELDVTAVDTLTLTLNYWYSETGNLSGQRAATAQVIQMSPDRNADGSFGTTYTLDWELPEVESFDVVLNPDALADCFDEDTLDLLVSEEELAAAWEKARVITIDGVTFTYDVDTNKIHAEGLTLEWTNHYINPENITVDGQELAIYYRRLTATYTVQHMLQDLDADGNALSTYTTLYAEETQSGRATALSTATALEIPGYRVNAFSQQPISQDGSTIITITYNRIQYRIIFETSGGTYFQRQIVPYLGSIDLSDYVPTKNGYDFGGWTYEILDDNGDVIETVKLAGGEVLTLTDDVVKAAVLDEETDIYVITLQAVWTPQMTDYQVVFWTQNADNDDYANKGSVWVALEIGSDPTELLQDTSSVLWTATADTEGAYTITTKDVNGDTISTFYNLQEAFESLFGEVSLTGDETDTEESHWINESVFFHLSTDDLTESAKEVRDTHFRILGSVRNTDGSTTETDVTTLGADGEEIIYIFYDRNVYTLEFQYYRTIKTDSEGHPLLYDSENKKTYAITDSSTSAGFILTNIEDSTDTITIIHAQYVGNGNSPNHFYYILADEGDTNVAYQVNAAGYGALILAEHSIATGWHDNIYWFNVSAETASSLPGTYTITARYGQSLTNLWPVDTYTVTSQFPEDYYANGAFSSIYGAKATVTQTWLPLYGGINMRYTGYTVDEDGTIVNSDTISYDDTNTIHAQIKGRVTSLSAELVADPEDPTVANVFVNHWSRSNLVYYTYNIYFDVGTWTDTNNDGEYDEGETVTYYEDMAWSDIQMNEDGSFVSVRYYYNEETGATKVYALAYQTTVGSTGTTAEQTPANYNHYTRMNDAGCWDTITASNGTEYTGYYNSQEAIQPATSNNVDDPWDLYYYYDRDTYTITYYNDMEEYEVVENVPYDRILTTETYYLELTEADCLAKYEGSTGTWVFSTWSYGPAGTRLPSWDTETVTGDINLYASWTPPTYTVTFDLNGATYSAEGYSDVQTFLEGDTVTEDGVTPRPTYSVTNADGSIVRYILVGWYEAATDENGNTLYENGHMVPSDEEFAFDKALVADHDVVAVWTPQSTTVSYTVYYVIAGSEATEENPYGTPVAESVTYTGYTIGTTVWERPAQPEGDYAGLGYVADAANKSLLLEEGGAPYVLVFYYSRGDNRDYIIQYMDVDTGEIVYTSVDPLDGDTVYTTSYSQLTVYPGEEDVAALDEMWYDLVLVDTNGNVVTDSYGRPVFADNTADLGQTKQLLATADLAEVPEDNIYTFLVKKIYTITYLDALDDTVYTGEGYVASYQPLEDRLPVTVTAVPTKTGDGFTYVFAGWTLGYSTVATAASGTNEYLNGSDLSYTINIEYGSKGNLVFVAQWYALEVEKTVYSAIPEDGYQVGDQITYLITVTNHGSLDITEDITITDSLPGAVLNADTIVGGLKANESASVKAVYIVTEADAAAGVVENAATASVTISSPQGDDTVKTITVADSDTVTVTIGEAPASTAEPSGSPAPTATATPNKAPATGDETNIALWAVLALGCAAGLMILARKGKRKA